MSKATQIGWYNLKEDRIFRNTYECAAWYEDVFVKAGKYPVVVYDFRVLKHDNPDFNNRIEGHISGTYTCMNGTIKRTWRKCGYSSFLRASRSRRYGTF